MVLQALNPLAQLAPNEKNDLEKVLTAIDDTDEEEKMRQVTGWLLYGIDQVV